MHVFDNESLPSNLNRALASRESHAFEKSRNSEPITSSLLIRGVMTIQGRGWIGGGVPCRMSIIRNGIVTLSNLRKAPVALSNLRKAPVALSNLRKAPVACH